MNMQYSSSFHHQHGAPSSQLKRYLARMEKEWLVRVSMNTININKVINTTNAMGDWSHSPLPVRVSSSFPNSVIFLLATKVRMLSIITGSYLIFWGPLFVVTVWHWSWGWEEAKKSLAHEVISRLSFRMTGQQGG